MVAIELRSGTLLSPEPNFVVHKDDILLLEGRLEYFRQLDVEPFLEILPMRQYSEHDLKSASIAIIEALLSPHSQLIGKTVKEARFREKFGILVLAIWNGEHVICTRYMVLDKSIEEETTIDQGKTSHLF